MEGIKHRKPQVTKTCVQCASQFSGTEKAVGHRLYCSPACRNEHRKTQTGDANPRYNRIEVPCAHCGKPTMVQPAKARMRIDQYCSPECGKEGRRKKITGTVKPATFWRTLAKREYGKVCAICGFPHFVEVHHIIHRAKGGSDDLSNLIPLCPNHHGMAHANLISNKELRKAQETAKSRQSHLMVTVWDQPHAGLG